jgi:hypothetical protein
MGVGLPGSLPLGVVALIAQRLVLGRQISDSLLERRDLLIQRGDGCVEAPVLLTELFDQREGLRQPTERCSATRGSRGNCVTL